MVLPDSLSRRKEKSKPNANGQRYTVHLTPPLTGGISRHGFPQPCGLEGFLYDFRKIGIFMNFLDKKACFVRLLGVL